MEKGSFKGKTLKLHFLGFGTHNWRVLTLKGLRTLVLSFGRTPTALWPNTN